jgi:RNA polymerase sigma-70 factor (ECF subfamily)
LGAQATSGPPTDPGSTDDQAFEEGLVRAVAGGEAEAFRVLMARYLDRVHAFLQRLTGSRTDAEDLTQETFLRVWRRADTYQPGRVRVSTWLFTIAHNVCIDSLRRQRPTSDGTPEPEADEPADPERRASADELSRALEVALRALPERQRSAVVLCQVQGFSNAQAASILGVGTRALESLLARARRALREHLDAALDADPRPGDDST